MTPAELHAHLIKQVEDALDAEWLLFKANLPSIKEDNELNPEKKATLELMQMTFGIAYVIGAQKGLRLRYPNPNPEPKDPTQ